MLMSDIELGILKKWYTYIPLRQERIQVGVPHRHRSEFEQPHEFSLLVPGLLLEFLDLCEGLLDMHIPSNG